MSAAPPATGRVTLAALPEARSARTAAQRATATQGPPATGRFEIVRATGAVCRRLARPWGRVHMVPGELTVGSRRLVYAVSDNVNAHGPEGPGSPPLWAVNLHGYFAGGESYWRESALLAERLGWRVLNPSLPGFGGSDPLELNEVSIDSLADGVARVAERLGARPAVLLGHSMGAAVAVRYAVDHPERVLGLVYRDGVATPAWQERHGLLPSLLRPLLPDVAPAADLVMAAALDSPDLLVGRLYSTMRAVLPDVRRNVQTVARTLPVANMLMAVDLRPELRRLVARRLPLLAEWGCFDRVANGRTAAELSACARTPVVWVPGGHSWMLARPQGQADLLRLLPIGRHFMAQVEERWRRLVAGDEPPPQAAAG